MRRVFVLMTVFAALASGVQPHANYDFGNLVTLEGTIKRVQAVRGQGMPYLEVKRGDEITKVQLGSMRYLLSKDFNPKAGEAVVVEGFLQPDKIVVAKRITLASQEKELELRAADGTPLWQRGRHGRRGSPATMEKE